MLFFTACSDYLALFDDPRFFKQISSAEELFDTINDGIYKFENEIDVQTTTYDEFMDYWHELEGQMALHSAFREQDVKIRYSNKEEGVCKIRIIMELNACGQAMQYLYAKNVNKYPSKEAEKVGEKLLEIKETIVHDGMSDQDKVRAIHDFIISHYKYAVNGEVTQYSKVEVLFDERQGQCQAYAELFVALCLLSGVQAQVISGRSTFGFGDGAHAWCLVRIASIWYHVDPTWDDPIPDEPQMIRYDFYLKGDFTMTYTHTWCPYYMECFVDYAS